MQFFVHCNFFCQKYNFTYLLTKQLLPIKWLIISFLIWDSIKLVGFVKLCAFRSFVPYVPSFLGTLRALFSRLHMR